MNNCISKEDYKTKGRKITDLPNLDKIYDLCMIYEDYKKGQYFDIQDLVNFLIRQVKLELKDVKLIDYLFIDEIQDLAINQIYLLILVSKYCKIYAGDTCQTISKINRFRFSELNNIFYGFHKIIPNYPKVINAYLCLNYRLNSKILRLSTFMAYLMKLLFPNTIDKFQDDFSIKIIEQKPIYLRNIDLIINNIINNHQNDDYTLAANHCFLYNNENDETILDNLYGDNIYKLNVEQSKGLEFEIVIVYNFFSSSKFQGLWEKIFKNLKGEKNLSINSSSKVQLRNILCQEDFTYLLETLNLRNIYLDLDDYNIQKKIINELDDFVYPKLNINLDKHEIFEFCSELKQFYVIITRPKTFLVFYESNLNRERESFYELMKSEDIELIVGEENEDTQNQFLLKVKNYFRDINLQVKSSNELRILGNNEFIEGHYSRAAYLYKTGRHYLLSSISEIFSNNEIINERINIYSDKSPELIELNNKIIDNITDILNKHENNNLNNINENDENRININNVINQIISIKGNSLIFLERYDEAIELFKKYKMINEILMIYFLYKKDYKLAFENFDSILNYRFALESVKNMKNVSRILEYTNKIAFYRGIVEYNDIYIEYVNSYFRIFFIVRNKLDEELIIKNQKYNKKANHHIIKEFFVTYLNQINNLHLNMKLKNNFKLNKSSQDSIDNFYNYNLINSFFFEQFEKLKEELKLDLDTIHFINVYYFNIPKNILIELLKLFPEFIFFNTTNFNVYSYVEKYFRRNIYLNLINNKWRFIKYIENKYNVIFVNVKDYYQKMEIILDYFLYHSEYNKDDKFLKNIFPFLINHGYFYFKLEKYFPKNSKEVKLFFDLSLNNYNLIADKDRYLEINNEINKNDYLLFYLSYLLRIGITDFILTKNNETLNQFLFVKYNGFSRLIKITENINKKGSSNEYYFYKYIEYKGINDDIFKLINFLTNEKIELTKKEDLIEYLDIGSSLSLFLIIIYFNNTYQYNINLKDESFLHLFENLYNLCNLISSSSFIDEKLSYNKKLILFSIFSIFNVSPLPFNSKILHSKVFTLYKYINGCLLNYNSILFSKEFFQFKK